MADTKLSKSRLEALIAMASGMVAQPASGLAGLYGLATGDYNKAADNVAATQQALTYAPRDPRGLRELAGAMEPVTGRLERLKHFLGDKAEAHGASPLASTAAYMVPDTLLALIGARGLGMKGPKLAELVQDGPTMGSARSQIGALRPEFKAINSETWPDGTVIDFGESPFPQLSSRVRLPTGRDVAEAPVEEIPLDGLHSTQTRITRNGLDKPRDDSHGLPIVVESNGIRYIQDGHHRLSADLFAGKQSAKVRLIRKAAP